MNEIKKVNLWSLFLAMLIRKHVGNPRNLILHLYLPLFGVLVTSHLCPSPEGNNARTENFKCLKIDIPPPPLPFPIVVAVQ